MARQPPASLAIDLAEHTLAEAYACLKIEDTNIPDGDVVVAFWASLAARKHKALEVIARRRQSQWLAFVLTILPHLTKANVALLAQPSTPAGAPGSPSDVKIEGSSSHSKLNAAKDSQSDTQHPNAPLTPAGEPPDGDVTMTPASSDDDATIPPEDSNSASSERTVSSGIPLSEEDSADSDFDEPIGGRYWNGHSWRCEECNEELVHGRCPNGDIINPCKNCGRDFQSDACSTYCDECHAGLQEQCRACGPADHVEQDKHDGIKMAWDTMDEVWRCTVCSWEVEANSEEEGHCHCEGEPKHSHQPMDVPGYQRARRIDLLYYHEYEPADSDSSGSESTDSEPDSDDEAFIEDDGPFDPALLTLEPPLYQPDEYRDTDGSGVGNVNGGLEPMDTA